jgi:hypothetical protein
MEQEPTTYDIPIWVTRKDRRRFKTRWYDTAWGMPIATTLMVLALPLLPVLFCVGWVKQKLFPLTSAPLPDPEEQRNREERFRYKNECCIHFTCVGGRSDFRYTMTFDEWKAGGKNVESGSDT